MGQWYNWRSFNGSGGDPLERHVDALSYELRMNSCATIAAALIAASGRAHSVHDALKVVHDVKMAMEPNRDDAEYVDWAEKFDGDKVHS